MEAIERQIEYVKAFCDGLFGPFEFHKRTPEGDRYDLTFRYCGKPITWNILYDLGNLGFAPDFIIPSEPETLFVPLSQFQSLQKFTAQDPHALLPVIYELINFYKDYQKSLVKEFANERVQFQYSVIESDQNTLFLFDRTEAEVRFMIPLGVDVAAELGGTEGSPDTKLLCPQILDRFMSKMPRLPQWTGETAAIDYLEQTRNSVKAFLNGVKSKKRFIQTCIVAFGSPVEYDSFTYSRVAFYFKEIEAVVHFALPDSFPEKQPSITLQSLVYLKGNTLKPIQIIYDTYPYSPRWTPDELAKRIRTFLLEKKFKEHCAEEVAKDEKSRS